MKLTDLVQGLPSTRLLYLEDSYLKECSCNILRIEPDDRKGLYVITDQSIFHPKSGGQPSDTGKIIGQGFTFEVKKVMFAESSVVHWGKSNQGEIQTGPAELKIEWLLRFNYMRRHTAAHLFDNCLTAVLNKSIETIDSWVGDGSYVGYRGAPPSTDQLRTAEEMVNSIVSSGSNVTAKIVTRDEAAPLLSEIPNLDRLPKNRELRIVTIEGFKGILCGGTHVKNTKEIGQFKFNPPQLNEEGFRINFGIVS